MRLIWDFTIRVFWIRLIFLGLYQDNLTKRYCLKASGPYYYGHHTRRAFYIGRVFTGDFEKYVNKDVQYMKRLKWHKRERKASK